MSQHLHHQIQKKVSQSQERVPRYFDKEIGACYSLKSVFECTRVEELEITFCDIFSFIETYQCHEKVI